MLKIKYYLDPGAYIPERAHQTDAGFDLRSPMEITIPANGDAFIPTGVHFAIPDGYTGFIKSRSGLNRKNGLTCEGVIDAPYRGCVGVTLANRSKVDYTVKKGDRVAQIVFLPIPDVMLMLSEDLGETERGDGGFGSTGR